MNNRKRIEEFLKIWAQVGIENPNFSYRSQDTHDLIYHNLIMQGVNPKDKKIDLTPTFDKWKDFFKDYSNISVFVDPNWSYFCQFVSKDPTASMQPENIKVYIPLDGEHIERGVKEIMAFLANHSISHQSKVSKKIRFDDVVVRLANESDARKLLDFIKLIYLIKHLLKSL